MIKESFITYVFAMIIMSSNVVFGQKAAGEIDQQVKNQAVPEGKAMVYIVRPAVAGFAVPMDLVCDDNYIGTTYAKRFVCTILDPGQHLFVSKSENKGELVINLEAGQKYYIKQKVQIGVLVARTELKLLDEKIGVGLLNKCKLSTDNAHLFFSPDYHGERVKVIVYRKKKKEKEALLELSVNDSIMGTYPTHTYIELDYMLPHDPLVICVNQDQCQTVTLKTPTTVFVEFSHEKTDDSPTVSKVDVQVGEFYSKKAKYNQDKRKKE